MNFRRLRSGLGLVAFLAFASAGASVAQTNPNAPPPPPLPNTAGTAAPNQALTVPATSAPTLAPNAVQSAIVPSSAVPAASPTPAPAASPSAGPTRGKKARAPGPAPSAEPSDTPAPPQFTTLDGVWEIELQPIGHRLANYQHFNITQSGSNLTGYWEHDPHKTHTPITGSFDGRLITISATGDTGSVTTFSGYVEDFGDMVGLQHVSTTDPGTAFTAQHRKKDKG